MATGTKEIILNAALKIVDKEGFWNITFERICETYKLEKKSIEKHFPNKNEIIYNLSKRELERVLSALDKKDGEASYQDLIAIMNSFVNWGRTYPNRFGMIFRPYIEWSEEYLASTVKMRKEFIDNVCEYIKRPVKGVNPETIAYILWSLCTGAILLEIMSHFKDGDKKITSTEELIFAQISLLYN